MALLFESSTRGVILLMVESEFLLFFHQTVNDTSPEVREASFMAIGTAMKVVTEKNIMAYLNDVDDIKMQKVCITYFS